MNTETYKKLAVFLLLIFLTFVKLIWLFINDLPLYGDEAQYWFWSKNLDFGYYSKPPLIAAVIHITTMTFGDSEGAIRLASPILHLFTAFITYLLGKHLFRTSVGLGAALIYLFMPGVFVSSALMSTEPILLACWSLALLFFVFALQTDKIKWWFALGIISGVGLLTKYNMGIFAVASLIFFLINREERSNIKNYKLYLTALIAFIIWLPNLVWNYEHEFISFTHTADLAGSNRKLSLSPGNLLKFLGEQFLLFGPVVMLSFLVYLTKIPRRFLFVEEKLLLTFSMVFLIIISTVALTFRAHGNWAAPAYIGVSILVSKFLLESNYRWVITLSIILHSFVYLAVTNYENTIALFGQNLTYKNDIYRRVRGNDEIGKQVSHLAKQYPGAIFASEDRILIATLIYYSDPHLFNFQKFNPSRAIEDHFDLVSNLNKYKGRDVIIITGYYNENSLKNFGLEAKKLATIKHNKYKVEKAYDAILIKKFKGY